MSNQRLYRVMFRNQGEVFELYARNVSHGSIMGFVEIEGLVFGEKSSILIDPVEERLKKEFENVDRTYVSIHNVIRIDQVTQQGRSKIRPDAGDSSKVTPFPGMNRGETHPK